MRRQDEPLITLPSKKGGDGQKEFIIARLTDRGCPLLKASGHDLQPTPEPRALEA